MVSHFLNKVAEFADHVVVIDKDSGAFSAGTTAEVLRNEILSRIFGLDLTIEQVAGKMRIYTAVGGRDK
jgi:ABC-type cobalamin/Fe3+-siderophores transport system ATPase subunit